MTSVSRLLSVIKDIVIKIIVLSFSEKFVKDSL
jgi:hypothetical protein